MIKTKNITVIGCSDWDNLVQHTYQKPYCFQQQDGCKEKGAFYLTIPCEDTDEEEMNDSIPEVVNGYEMGVKFEVWLARDPNQPITNQKYDWELELFWERNFYPDIHTLANDLHSKGLIEAGDYLINIDW